jgi:hypothetical protein
MVFGVVVLLILAAFVWCNRERLFIHADGGGYGTDRRRGNDSHARVS